MLQTKFPEHNDDDIIDLMSSLSKNIDVNTENIEVVPVQESTVDEQTEKSDDIVQKQDFVPTKEAVPCKSQVSMLIKNDIVPKEIEHGDAIVEKIKQKNDDYTVWSASPKEEECSEVAVAQITMKGSPFGKHYYSRKKMLQIICVCFSVIMCNIYTFLAIFIDKMQWWNVCITLVVVYLKCQRVIMDM